MHHPDDSGSAAALQRIEAALVRLEGKANVSMSKETRLLELAQETNDITNRGAAAAAGIQEDLTALKALLAEGTVSDEAVAAIEAAIANAAALAAVLEATNSAYPVPEPTPVPTPEEPTEVPPVEDAPGTEPIPDDEPTP